MRGPFILLLVICLAGCSTAEMTPSPGPIAPSTLLAGQVSQPDSEPTPLPGSNDDPLIPPSTPSYACELQNDTVIISDSDTCRSERIQEVVAAEGEDVVFIHRTFHRGYGCWSGVNAYSYQLKSCNLISGQSVTLIDEQTTPLLPSPDGSWLAFGVIGIEQFEPHVYRVRSDGTALQQLDTEAFPDWAVGLVLEAWSADGSWLALKLWDGTEDGWHPYRIATGGSGLYEAISPPTMTPPPTDLVQSPDGETDTPLSPPPADAMTETPTSAQTPTPDQMPSPTVTASAVPCSDTWFFSFPFEYHGQCPRPAVVSQAAVQPFERGLMIWLEQPGQYFVLTNQILYEGEPRKTLYIIADPLDIVADSSAEYLPPEGLFAPEHGFGLVWRGDAAQSSGFQDNLGWATGPETGYEVRYQCESPTISGGRTWQFCYLSAANGEVIVVHALGGWLWLSAWEQ